MTYFYAPISTIVSGVLYRPRNDLYCV